MTPLGSKQRKRRRKDQYGNRIMKGAKGHKIIFADQISIGKEKQKIEEVFIVENYKKYNRRAGDEEDDTSYCNCSIL